MQTIVIINQKGGCGKTTSAINLAGVAAMQGRRTLLIDLDPQSHCAAGLAIPEQRIDLDIGDAMLAEKLPDRQRLMWRAARNLDLIPSRLKLAGLEAARGGLASKPDKDRRLARVLEAVQDDYDLCIVDCSPSIGLLTYNALVAASDILIPVETSYFSLQGATKQVNTIKALEARLGVSAPYCILPTIHEPDSALATDLINELGRRFGDKVCPTAIRRDRALKESASFGQPVVEYAPSSDGAIDYSSAAEWLLADEQARKLQPRPEKPKPIEPMVTPAAATEPKQQVKTTRAVATATATIAKKIAEPQPTAQPAAQQESASQHAAKIREQIMGGSTSATATLAAPATQKPAKTAVRLIEPDSDTQPAVRPMTGRIVIAEPKTEPKAKPSTPSPAGENENGSETQSKPLAGVRVTPGLARFALPTSLGSDIRLAGDFNHWSEHTLVFQRRDELGLFELEIPLVPGRYRYRIIVDGTWQDDPTNPAREPNEYGAFNSVVIVPQADA